MKYDSYSGMNVKNEVKVFNLKIVLFLTRIHRYDI